MFKIGLISIKEDSGCTSLGIHIANFLASGQLSVALFENKTKEEFKTIKADVADDGTFVLNKVRYIPSNVTVEVNTDVEVHIIGVVNFLSEFDDSFDKVYLCTDPDIANVRDIQEYFHEANTTADIILLGASKEQLDFYSAQNFRCVNIGGKKEDIIPLALANHISLAMRMKGIVPPTYNKDVVYDEVIFNWEPKEENTSGGGFFGMFGKKKKKEQPQKKPTKAKEVVSSEEKPAVEPEPEEYTPHVYQRNIANTQEKEYTFVNVPAPTAKDPTTEEEPVTKTKTETQKVQTPEKKTPTKEKEKVPEPVIKEVIKEDPALKAELKKQQEIIKQKEKEAKALAKKAEAEAKAREKEEKEKAAALEKAQRENEKLHHKATHDELCGIKNRVGFEEDAKNLKQYVLVMFDVNNLKTTNDTLGHKSGDRLLKTVSKTIASVIPELYRCGGDEFIGIIHGVSKRDETKIIDLLSSIDSALEKASVKDKSLNYSVAYGYAFSSEGKLDRVKELADERMYEDKAKKKAPQEMPSDEKSNLPEPEKTSTIKHKSAEKKSLFDALRLGNNTEKVTDTLKVGHLTVFVTGVSHSVGTSFVAGSIASSMTDIYNENVWLELSDGGDYPDNYMVKPVMDDNDRFTAFKSPIYVEEKGVYSLLSDSDMGDMLRADINIMVTTASENDLREVAAFIKQNEAMAANWVFAFNHVHKAQEKLIHSAMKDYNYVIIPFHDNAEVDLDLRKTYIKIIDEFVG